MGRRVALTAAGLLLVGAVFYNLIVLAFSSLLLLFLSIEGTVFHRSVSMAKTCLTVTSDPQTIKCAMGRPTEVQHEISNSSNQDLRITGLFLPRQAQSTDQRLCPGEFLLKKHEKQSLRARIECTVPGRFNIQTIRVILTSRTNLFTQTVWAPCKATLISRPAINTSRLASIDSSSLDDLTSDRIRRGVGTDLAGVKPSTVMDDLHRVDWKATARTGRLMVKEFFLDRQPPIVLLIDASRSMKATRKGKSIFSQLLTIFPNLLASIRPATPMGLILYDENSVITELASQVGEHQRALVLNALLSAKPEDALSSVLPARGIGSAEDFVAISRITRHSYQNVSDLFAARISWFETSSRLRRYKRIVGEGAFMAMSRMRNLSESSLTVAVTDGKTNLEGLVEGSRIATVSGHRVILVLLIEPHKVPTSYIFPELERVGLSIRACLPQELSAVIHDEIARMSRKRVIPTYIGTV